MNKKILSVTALSLVLVGCQQQAKNAVDSMANKAEEVKNSAVEKKLAMLKIQWKTS